MNIIIRPLRRDDIPAVLRLAAAVWGRFYGQVGHPDFKDMFAPSSWSPYFYVADQGGRIVGSAGYYAAGLDYGIFSIGWVCVHPDCRRVGLGSALVRRCLGDLAGVADHVVLTTSVPEFYAPLGFIAAGRMATAHSPDGVLMRKDMADCDAGSARGLPQGEERS